MIDGLGSLSLVFLCESYCETSRGGIHKAMGIREMFPSVHGEARDPGLL
jgi:hypothetical protein